MSHTYRAQFVHVVVSTKERRDLIPPNLEPRLIPYLAGTIKSLAWIPSPSATRRTTCTF